jgi:branched-subunit amino acid ABC-type transport system permease component
MVIIGACYVIFFLVTGIRWTLGLAIPVGIATAVLLMLIMYFGFFRKLLTAPHTSMILLTAGLANIVQQIIILTMGSHPKFVPAMITGSATILGVVLSRQQILTIIFAFAMAGLLSIFFKYTKMGRAIRAVTQDRDIAVLLGVNAEGMYVATMIIAGILAGMAGVLVAPIQTVTPQMGWELIMNSFTVAILAGLGGPIWGVIIAAAIVAYAELIAAFSIDPLFKEAASYLIMILTLMFRPSGLFGKGGL